MRECLLSVYRMTYIPYGPGMIYYLFFYTIALLVFYILIMKNVIKLPQAKDGTVFVIIFTLAILIRIVLAISIPGYPNDIATFKAWAIAAAKDFSGLYTSGMFLDYPPLYMYVLYIIGKLISIPSISPESILFIKLPSILADVTTALLVYYLTEKKIRAGCGYIAAALFLFNPAILMNSVIWGMVDSFFMLFVIAALLLVADDKVEYSVIFFAAAVLMKPQGIFFLPVLIFEIIRKKSFKKLALTFIYGFLTTAVIILPFFSFSDPLWIFKLYLNTASGYTYASLNAYNLFSLLGANLKQDSETLLVFSYNTWGLVFDFLMVIFTGRLYFKYRGSAAPILTALLLNSGFFIFSSRMHERYMYPVIVLSLLLFIYLSDSKIPLLFTALTIIVTLNMNDVLSRALNTAYPHIPADDPVLFWCSVANVILFVSMSAFAVRLTKYREKSSGFINQKESK